MKLNFLNEHVHLKIWSGMTLRAWLKVLSKNCLNLRLTNLHSVLFITVFCCLNLPWMIAEYLLYHKKTGSTEIKRDPVFIIGHWRSGTTLLHELLNQDKQFAAPNTYQCFFPSHFLLTEPFFRRILDFVMPEKRPMDNMKLNGISPQEDEFALCNLGAPSPYEWLIFPREESFFLQSLKIDFLSPAERLVIKTFDLLHETIEEETRDIPPAHLIELDFESLIADPIANLKRIYSQLQLEGFVETREAFITYTREHQNYKKNSYEIRPEDINLLNNVWGRFIRDKDRSIQ